MNTMSYLGYEGIVTFDEEDDLFHGEVANLRDVITFQGRSIEELRAALREGVEDYLEFCRSRGEEPEPLLHRTIASAAKRAGVTLDDWVARALQKAAA